MSRTRKPPGYGSLSLRGAALLYVGLLIVLPVIAISSRALGGGITSLWTQITSPQAMAALKLTLLMAFIMVLINVVTGTAMAWVLVRYRFPLKKVINAMIDIPFAIPTVVTGIMLVVLYGPRSILGTLFSRMGVEIIFDKPGIVLALLFVTFPFVVRSVQPVLMEMEPDMEEAAQTLGASRSVTFFRIVLPTLLPAILTGAALSFSRALGEFGSVVIVAGNIPLKTQTAPVYVFGEIESGNVQSAMGVSLFLLFSSFLVLVMLKLIQNRSQRHVEST